MNGDSKQFEYDITKHSAELFTQLVYFCNSSGECDLNQLPSDQLKTLGALLNEKGSQGWELIQVVFGEEGIVAFWKRCL